MCVTSLVTQTHLPFPYSAPVERDVHRFEFTNVIVPLGLPIVTLHQFKLMASNTIFFISHTLNLNLDETALYSRRKNSYK